METTNYLQNQGVATPGIVGIDYCDGYAYELQEKCDGKLIAFRSIEDVGGEDEYIEDFLKTLNILNNADPSVFLKLMNSTRLLHINGYNLDCHSDNYMIDNNGNIAFIDVDIYHKKETKNDMFINYINVLPNILSFALYALQSSSNSKYKDACIPLLKSIGYKWLEQCVNYLSAYGFTNEEIIKQVRGISFNYFMIDKTEKDNMITSYFSSDVSEKGNS